MDTARPHDLAFPLPHALVGGAWGRATVPRSVSERLTKGAILAIEEARAKAELERAEPSTGQLKPAS